MYNAGKVIIGIIIFLLFCSMPFMMNNSGVSKSAPKLEYPADAKKCIYEKEYMNHNHMNILNDWRDKVVRQDTRYFDFNGVQTAMSLSKTCMKCHTFKVKFCDKCHNYLGEAPYCWDCHVTPEEVKK